MTTDCHSDSVGSIPARAGIGLRAPHHQEILETQPDVAWVEAHCENYFGAGGPPLRYLESIRETYPLSLHGVGLSLGSAEPPDRKHLADLKRLMDRFQPGLASEHLSWSAFNGIHSNDLLPLPYTEEALGVFCTNTCMAQDCLGRRLLIENPSSYLRFNHSTLTEPEFLVEVARRTGCGILLDINNVYVSANNHGFDADTYLASIPPEMVGELHLAGHAINTYGDRQIHIDDHGSPVSDVVWALFTRALNSFAGIPTLIEWDSEIPELDVLLAEARQANGIMEAHGAIAA